MAEDLIVSAPARLVHLRTKTTAWLKVQSQKYGTPTLVLLLAAAIVITMTGNWNAWEGARVEQVTNDAYVRGDLTPLSTKVAGLVREVAVTDYQTVHKGDELVRLVDDDYRAQVAQASAAVEAAKAALENKFEGGKKRANLAARRAQVAQAKENLTRLREEVELRVSTAYNKLERTRQMVAVSQELVTLRAESRRVTSEQLTRGAALRSLATASLAQELEAKALLLQSRLDYVQAAAELDQATGRTPR